ncbi:MAG TPA: FAD-dependent 5-carboxymethylaminomethyl-2-thiouridine(34) oxidoreductase MnmC, partial [Usitatibacter sp.]
MVTVPTARLERSADGTPFSPEFQDVYHSSHGGLQQARHVFLRGNDLPARWQGRDSFVIVETGFGLGVNFLAVWHAWRADPSRSRRLHFVSVESHPFTREDLAAALGPFAEIEELASALVIAWPPPLAGFHRAHFDGGNVILTLLFGEARAMLPQLVAQGDAFFLDGFSPARNPGIWSSEVVREIARLAAPGATLATWTVAGGVRTALADAGFSIEKRPGFAAKREMLVGRRALRGEKHEREGGGARPGESSGRRAVVIGAGLAGTLTAERLASRGWSVELVDAREERSVAAVGLVRPIANLRDAVNAQVSRSAFLYALQHFRALQHGGHHLAWNRCGVLQLAGDDDEASRFAAIAQSQGYPSAFLAHVDRDAARAIARCDVRGPGWWFPGGAWVAPASLAVASLARAGDKVQRRIGRHVARLEREGSAWRALDANDRVIAEAPVMVVASAVDAKRLVPDARLALSSVRGQVTYLPPSPRRTLDVIVSGSGYVAPLPGGGHCVGASYHHDDDDASVRAADHRGNLDRAESMLPGF